MTFIKRIIPTLLVIILISACATPLKTKLKDFKKEGAYRIAFYNVENLFDLEDAPDKADEEFTPTGKKEWTADRYQKKLDNLAKVFQEMGYPPIIGVCEVENAKVLEDLINKTSLKDYGYKYAHQESPDFRGIDVGMLYMSSLFSVEATNITRIDFPKEIVEDYTTRDILHVKGTFRGKEKMHFFINHWPSRRGGLEASEPKRVYVATQLRKETMKIFKEDPKANIIITGDFNDEPDNNSLLYTLNAKPTSEKITASALYNCSSTLDKLGKGTYNYKGNWNMLDQFIVSSALLDGSCSLSATDAAIFSEEWLNYNDKKYGPTPSRTYGGPNYYGGFSDHYPVYLDLRVR